MRKTGSTPRAKIAHPALPIASAREIRLKVNVCIEGIPVTTTITICDTCKRDDWAARETTETDGAALASRIEAAAQKVSGVRTRRHACLMGCGKGCNLAIQAQGKLTYVMGGFDPASDSAEDIVEYARLHSESATGQVPFRAWPQGVKGHFVSRLPVLDEADR